MNYTLLFSVWAVMACSVLALAGYRKLVARNEDDSVHLNDRESAMIGQQLNVAHRLEVIDKWGQIATIVVVALGLILGTLYLLAGWQGAGKLP